MHTTHGINRTVTAVH